MTQKLYEYTELTKLERAFLIYVFENAELPVHEDNGAFIFFEDVRYDDTTGFTKRQVMGIASSLVQKGILRTYKDDVGSGIKEIGHIEDKYVKKYCCEERYFTFSMTNSYGVSPTQKGMEVDA